MNNRINSLTDTLDEMRKFSHRNDRTNLGASQGENGQRKCGIYAQWSNSYS